MKLSQVYMTLEEAKFEPLLRAKYQLLANYLTLFISDWLKKLKLELGFFNRIVFQEGNDRDMSAVGDKAFRVCVEPEFYSLNQFATEGDVHRYFTTKYLEGFARFDKQFNLNLTADLQAKLENSFTDGLKYDIKAKPKKVGDVTVQALHRYKYDSYTLVVQKINKKKEILDEQVIFTCDPDPFVVHFDVNKVEIDDSKVRVINKVREVTLVYDL
ncbi:hypothetical protein OE749_02620 [Aestuariibacter sp. AA17]|uniref:Uncharacterized protein n=1 Tax=Fluctibacter corallii TaxID=2984329 RepID=A0ABT3A4S7_9ALTE|nr:hypothetical protein [Aestuariibacter sp. AA17]MCV2883592.1 hypothetical protein [Aestuariibacter sp. AA17]